MLSASIIENAPDGVFICDADEIIIEVNPAFTKITGYSASEAVGQHPGFLSDTDSNMDVEQNMRQTLQSQDLWQGEFYNRHKEGWACVMFVSVVQAWQRNQALYRLVVLQIGCAAF
ncbi:MAG: PAS domain-containing protein [Thiopseudomonas sp.]